VPPVVLSIPSDLSMSCAFCMYSLYIPANPDTSLFDAAQSLSLFLIEFAITLFNMADTASLYLGVPSRFGNIAAYRATSWSVRTPTSQNTPRAICGTSAVSDDRRTLASVSYGLRFRSLPRTGPYAFGSIPFIRVLRSKN